MSSLPTPKPTYAELEAEVALMREQMTVMEACHMFDRFHSFDAIKNDSCPCCGGRVKVVEIDVPPAVRLEAVPW